VNNINGNGLAELPPRFPPISFLSQNVQSLNVSTLCKKTSKKIISLTRERDDIIFICDIRLNSNKQVAATLDISKRFAFRGYKLIHNSFDNSRGVGILISNKLSACIHNQFCDMEGNILILDITIRGTRMTLGSVYGPNTDNAEFFNVIKDTCNRFGNRFTILGGDWNTTVDCRPVRTNIDTLNMVDIPSK
jgi:hypothetical protein